MMIVRIYFVLPLLFWGINFIYAQESWPPYKISRLFHFTFSESLGYDSNLLQNEYNQQKDFFINHGLSIMHSDERPYFAYQMSYSFSYRNFFQYSELNDDSHFLTAQVSIQRPYYTINISNQFNISSEPRSIEFDAFNKSTSNITSIQGEYRFTDKFKMNFFTTLDTQEYTEIPFSDSKRWSYSVSAFYQAANRWTLSGVYEENKSWYTGSNAESDYSVVKGNISYKILESLFIFTGIEYTFMNRTNQYDEDYYTIPYGIKIIIKHESNSQSETNDLQWLQSLSFSINSNLSNRNFQNPIDFNISANGYITQKTTWSLTATRRLDFSYLSEQQQYQTSLAFALGHIFHDLRIQTQFAYQIYEYENNDVLKSMDWSLSFGYPITKRLYLNARYSFNKRFAENFYQDYSAHRFSMGSSLSF